jgi:hypothetical protein
MINKNKESKMLDNILSVIPFIIMVFVSVGGFLFAQYQKKFDKSPNK